MLTGSMHAAVLAARPAFGLAEAVAAVATDGGPRLARMRFDGDGPAREAVSTDVAMPGEVGGRGQGEQQQECGHGASVTGCDLRGAA